MKTVSVLFARSDSVYKSLPGTDVFDIVRDALTFQPGQPVIAHPPCRAWGNLSHFAKPRHDEKQLAIWSIEQVRLNGGVLEHPAGSRLFRLSGMPSKGRYDSYGGFTIGINQSWFGHRAEKKTILYVCGCKLSDVPEVPFFLDYPTHVIESHSSKKYNRLPSVSKKEREQTPLDLAVWLLDLARRCAPCKPQ